MAEKLRGKMPQHVIEQRAAEARARASNRKRVLIAHRSEMHDVFKRINMHGGSKELCWEWRGAHGKGTRGEYRPRVVIGQRSYYVHRVVYTLYTGYTPKQQEVIRHSCDNPWCCNPYHMIIGTQADNVRDMLERERVGLKLFHIKRIMQMLELGCTAKYVCEKMREGYNMSLDVSVIRKIRMRTIYKHVEWPWGDEYAEARRRRLRVTRAARKAAKLACDPDCDIMVDTTNSTQGEQHGSESNTQEGGAKDD